MANMPSNFPLRLRALEAARRVIEAGIAALVVADAALDVRVTALEDGANAGTAELDFGAFPGKSHISVDVVAVGVISTSAIKAWIRPVDTVDHTADEHIVESIRVVGQYLSDGNIRIHGYCDNQLMPPMEPQPAPHDGIGLATTGAVAPRMGRQDMPMLVGKFNVSWAWWN